MSVSPTMYNDLVTSAATRQDGWQAAADAFRRKASELDEDAKEKDRAASALRAAGDFGTAEKQEDEARQLRDDAGKCLVYAAKTQEKANSAQSPAA